MHTAPITGGRKIFRYHAITAIDAQIDVVVVDQQQRTAGTGDFAQFVIHPQSGMENQPVHAVAGIGQLGQIHMIADIVGGDGFLPARITPFRLFRAQEGRPGNIGVGNQKADPGDVARTGKRRILVSIIGQRVIVFSGVERHGQTDGFKIVDAAGAAGARPGRGERGQQHRRQDRDNGNYHQKFYQCEAGIPARPPGTCLSGYADV
ncbi:hypothetical protein SDC9_96674 [bioreactor metagenome]|uniref:Uncharacterized protein n=1 Tax=bioreactor metagenome TaxID=1076179 RepID=A0A645A9S2_9ZZZZ